MTESKAPDSRWQRLRGHGAFQAGVLFASAAWLALQAADVFELPTTLVRVLGAVLLVVFGALMVYAWVDTRGPVGGSAARPGRRRTAAVIAAATVMIGLGALVWIYRPRLFGGVRPGADVIAVLPFRATGPSFSMLGEGLVDLLSTNLNAVGPIRTVDPRTTLYRWRQVAQSGELDLAGALAIGKAVDAGSVLMGSVVEAGGRARLNAELFAVGGNRLASAEIEGASDSIFALVDDLSIRLVRDIWRSREPIPELRLSALTTTSPSALRAFLAGEKHFRASQWDSARADFEAAVADDSTFALAYARLSETYGWTESLGAPAAQQASRAAERFSSRLPDRDRTLLAAHRLHEAGDLATIDTLRAFVNRYPDDAAGWHLLADAQFHARLILGLTPEQVYEPFERVIELDPSFAPALEHPMEFAIAMDDSVRFARYLSLVREAGNNAQAGIYTALHAIRWGPREARASALSSAYREHLRNPGDFLRVMSTHLVASMREPEVDPVEVEAGLDTAMVVVPASTNTRFNRAMFDAQSSASMGRIRRANQRLGLLRTLNEAGPFSVGFSLMIARMAPDALAPPLRNAILNPSGNEPPVFWFWRAYIASSDGDQEQARRYLGRIPPGDHSGLPGPIVDALSGLIRVAEGDTAAGLQQMHDAIRQAGYGPVAAGYGAQMTFEALLIEIADPAKRETAIRRIELLIRSQPGLDFLTALRLAAAYERAGEDERAVRLLARFLSVWERGDPDVQEFVESTRRTLERLTAEGVTG